MKYKDVAEHYDKLFKDDVSAQNWDSSNGGGPMPLVKALENFIASGDVLDIGAGVGRNCVYIVDEELKNDFDVIICAGVLHHLYTEDALSVIRKIQQHTKPMGFNIINTFTKRGDFYNENQNTKNFYIDSNEDLNNLYSNWTVHISFEKKGPTFRKGPNGEWLFNVFAGMLSQKK